MAYRKDWVQPQVGPQGFARTVKTFGRTVNVTAADNVTAAATVLGAFTVPAGFVVTSVLAISTVLGAGMVYNVGDAGLATRYLSAASGAAITPVTALQTAGLLYKNPAETEILVAITTGGAAAPAGSIQLYLTGYIDN
jgi:hypothetical protein